MEPRDDDEQTETPGGPKQPIEFWAEQKGMLPENVKVRSRVAQHAAVKSVPNPKFGDFAQAKALRSWPTGAEVTEAEFDKAVADAGGIALR